MFMTATRATALDLLHSFNRLRKPQSRLLEWKSFFTVRRYASAVYAVIACMSVCSSVYHKPVVYQNDWTNRAGFWHGSFIPPLPPLCCKEIWVSQTRTLPSGTLSRTPENLATTSRSRCHRNSSSS